MPRTIVKGAALMAVLLLIPIALAQGGPPGGTAPGGPPDSIPSQGPPSNANNASNHSSTHGPPPWAPVEVRDDGRGFTARPIDPGSQRPSFSYNASQARMAAQAQGAPGFSAVFDALLEFVDDDGDQTYDVGERIVQRVALRDQEATVWGSLQYERFASYALPNGGNLTVRFNVTPPGPLDATKFDIILLNFPFEQEESRIALGLHARAETPLILGTVDSLPAAVGHGSGAVPYLSWISEAAVDDNATLVRASVHTTNDGHVVIYWAYARGARIVHDPVIGFTFVTVEQLWEPVTFWVAFASGVVLLLAGFEGRRRMSR